MRISDWSSDVCSSDLDDGDAAPVEIGQQLHDLERAFAVEVAGRLVGEQHVGTGDDGAGDGDALLLAARKLGGRMIPPIGEADLVERGHARLVTRRLVLAAIEERQIDLFERAGAGGEIRTEGRLVGKEWYSTCKLGRWQYT